MSAQPSFKPSRGLVARRRQLLAAAGVGLLPAWAWGQEEAAAPVAEAPSEAPKPRPRRRAAKAPAKRRYPLAPGKFFWMPEISANGPVVALVNLHTQHVQLYRNGVAIGFSSVSTGKPGHGTPVGRFKVLERRRHHFSNLYENAPMPWMVRLTWDGIAFHGGRLPGYPASHGCVRLPMAFAPHLFGALSRGDTVAIVRQAPERYPAELSLLAPIDPQGQPMLLPEMLSQPEYWALDSVAAAAPDAAASAAAHVALQSVLAASAASAPLDMVELPREAAQRPAAVAAAARARAQKPAVLAEGAVLPPSPLSVLVSLPQQRLFVLRDGVVLAAAALPQALTPDSLGGHTLFTWGEAGGWHAMGEVDAAFDQIIWQHLLPASADFSARLRAALTPGSTLFISPLPAVNDVHVAVWRG